MSWSHFGEGGSIWVLCVFLGVLVVGTFYVWTRMQIIQIGYEISNLETKNNELKNRKRELILELSSLQSPRELESKAIKLGLASPTVDKVLHVPQ
jgi:cell division protein FtsL